MVGASFTVAAVAQVLRSKKGITAVGNAQVDTAQSKFGGASALFDGTDDYLRVLPNETFTGDFTMEMWIRPAVVDRQYQTLVQVGTEAPGRYVWHQYYDGLFVNLYGVGTYDITTSGLNLTANTWAHVAVVRSGSTVTIYANGTSRGTNSAGVTTYGNTGGYYIAASDTAAQDYYGHMDEIRISNIARYTGTFTPSTTPFVNDANTLLLIHANGTDGSTFFEDDNGVRSSTSLIATGAAKVSTTQNKFGGSSANFDGTSNTQVLVSSWNTSSYTGDFTIEGWFYITDKTTSTNARVWSDGDGSTTEDFRLLQFEYNTNQIYLVTGQSGNDSWNYSYVSATLNINTWYHIAGSRSGSSLRIFVNGTQQGSTISNSLAFTTASSNHSGRLGMFRTDASRFRGFIDDFRISNSARYTSNFTAPTAPFVNDANTLLLIHGDGTNASTVFTDDNGQPPFVARTAKTVTAVGNAQIDTAQSKFGGASAQFDGSGDYLTIPASNDFNFGTGNFTIEMWFRRISGGAIDIIVGNRGTGFVSGNFAFYTYSSSIEFDYRNDLIANNTLTTSISNNIWYHFAIVRNGTSLTLYKDGAVGQAKTIGSTETFGSSSIDLSIGCNTAGTFPLNGYIDELRISNTARYATTFTPSTAPFVNDANTLLLIHADGADATTTFTDDNISYRTKKGITAIGNAQIDTAQSKFGGASAQFDGTGDAIQCSDDAMRFNASADRTIELWIYSDRNNTTEVFLFQGVNTGSTMDYWQWYFTSTNLVLNIPGSSPVDVAITRSTGTWYHFAWVKQSNSNTVYWNGTSVATFTKTDSDWGLTDNNTLFIGFQQGGTTAFDGNIDEIRISSSARYTANFTPSTTPFQNDANTVLLLHCDGTDASTVFTDDNGIAPYTP
jgi:hypothetical protein